MALINLFIVTSEIAGATGPALATIYALALTMLWIKDGVNGQSLGKRLMGVQVIDDATGAPAGLMASCKRNLFLFVPIYPLIVAQLLFKGYRPGDSWARTKVILCRQRHLALFRPSHEDSASRQIESRGDESPDRTTSIVGGAALPST